MDDQHGYPPRNPDPYARPQNPYGRSDGPFARPNDRPDPYAQPADPFRQPYAQPTQQPTLQPTQQYGQGYEPGYAPPYAQGAPRGPERRRGRGKVVALVVIGLLLVAALAGGGAWLYTQRSNRTDGGSTTDSGAVAVQSLKVGDCLRSFSAGTVTSLDTVPCAQPHGAQVVVEFDFDHAKYPSTYVYAGNEKVKGAAEKGCLKRLPPSVQADTSIGISFLYPLKETWDTGDRKVTCLVTSGPDKKPLTKTYQ